MKKIIEELIGCDEVARKKILAEEEICRKKMLEMDLKLKKYKEDQEALLSKRLTDERKKSTDEESEHLQKLQRNTDVEINLLKERYEKMKDKITDQVLDVIVPKV